MVNTMKKRHSILFSVRLIPARSLWLLALLTTIAGHAAYAKPSLSSHTSAEEQTQRALQHIKRGDPEQAITLLSKAAAYYQSAANSAKASAETSRQLSGVWHYTGEAYQALGQYTSSISVLQSALTTARQIQDQYREAAIMSSLGQSHFLQNDTQKAQQLFNDSIILAKIINDNGLAATALNNLGNLHSAASQWNSALTTYKESAALAEASGNPLLAAKASVNTVRILMRDSTDDAEHTEHKDISPLLDTALSLAKPLPDSRDKAYVLLSIGRHYQRLLMQFPQDAAQQRALLARDAYKAALTIAKKMQDTKTTSYANGYLGHLYETAQQHDDALQYTRKAVFAAQQINAPEVLYRWQWQTARLLKQKNDIDAATSAYRQAVYSLESVRHNLVHRYREAPLSFREAEGSLYFELADLLLQRSAALKAQLHEQHEQADEQPSQHRVALQQPSQPNKKQNLQQQITAYLKETRDTLEKLKAAELRDYFQDDCVAAFQARATPLDTVTPNTAVIYPVLLNDRTELILSLPNGIQQYGNDINAQRISHEVKRFRESLGKPANKDYLRHANVLYEWLIRPIEAALTEHEIHTLVFVPDGALRSIPLAALYDGEQFLIDKYAVAITPGLSLTDAQPINRENANTLLTGLTDAVQGFSPLPYVSSELNAIEKHFTGTRLQNKNFVIPNMEKELIDVPYSIVHIATHGRFESNANDSFLVTYDGKLAMNHLGRLIEHGRFRDNPIELLTLSACETATGNDRAALGLAGLTVKSGARSALATLWAVSDEATAMLIGEFYKQLKNPNLTKAKALQIAQQSLIQHERFSHPVYWSPFLFIGNWL